MAEKGRLGPPGGRYANGGNRRKPEGHLSPARLPVLPEAVGKRVGGAGQRAVFSGREGDIDRKTGASSLSEAVRF